MGGIGGTRPSPFEVQEEEQQPVATEGRKSATKSAQHPIGGLPIFGKCMLDKEYDRKTVDLIMDAWRPSTKKLYSTYLRNGLPFVWRGTLSQLRPPFLRRVGFLECYPKKA